MARPTKWRKIENIPNVSFFIPSESEVGILPKNVLKVEELEAIRLKDLEAMEQEECAARMEISRPTFQRILTSARKKIADSLINGKAINIEGGNFTLNICPVKCAGCDKEWLESYENFEAIKYGNYLCPNCGSDNIRCKKNHQDDFCRKNCWRHGRKDRRLDK